MIKKISILLLCFSILAIKPLGAEEKFLSLKKNKTNADNLVNVLNTLRQSN